MTGESLPEIPCGIPGEDGLSAQQVWRLVRYLADNGCLVEALRVLTAAHDAGRIAFIERVAKESIRLRDVEEEENEKFLRYVTTGEAPASLVPRFRDRFSRIVAESVRDVAVR